MPTADLDINMYDCGGGKRYSTTQLPYLTGVALCMVVVEAHYATDEHAVALGGKLHRFLVLQHRIPGAMIMPNVTKVDSIKDPGRWWLERKIENWLQDKREAMSGNRRDSSAEHFQTPALLAPRADADIMQYAQGQAPLYHNPLQSPARGCGRSASQGSGCAVPHYRRSLRTKTTLARC